ncbi:neutrophilic granule protein-like isoform X2 [Monodelphis domestica]|uniref:neutrophilic granule protein-like isoform X2 n=1 Tax=Monodelphis domestica TaxID=13616 RepID=UPI0024E208FA|nr:neutrophilic granule protein-like isoform X2 [Monodelphis domestica]
MITFCYILTLDLRGRRMENTWRVLLLLGLATVVSAAPRRVFTYKEAAVLASRNFNRGSNEGRKYRVVEASLSTPDSPLELPLTFRIKETECPSTERQDPETCAFRENGAEKQCTANFTKLSRFGLRSLNCVDIVNDNNQPTRFKRASSNEFIDTSSLPPRIKQIVDQARYDLISRILSNF